MPAACWRRNCRQPGPSASAPAARRLASRIRLTLLGDTRRPYEPVLQPEEIGWHVSSSRAPQTIVDVPPNYGDERRENRRLDQLSRLRRRPCCGSGEACGATRVRRLLVGRLSEG